MYPYNRKTQLCSTPIQTKESTLSDDRRLQELLILAKQDAVRMEEKYAALAAHPSLAEADSVLHAMRIDCKKHQRILREILFTLFSDAAEDISAENTETEIESSDALLEEILFAELDDVAFYRTLLAAMEADDLWTLLFEVLTDKQNHAAALNHLYAKYLQ